MEKDTRETIREISDTLKEINRRQELGGLFEKSERRVENATYKIQESFDRIHDKVFNFNNVLVGAYLVLGTFPSDAPKLNIWTTIFPILVLIYLVYLDWRQMEIHRYATGEMEWTQVERDEYGKKLKKQTQLSFLALVCSVACFIYLLLKIA